MLRKKKLGKGGSWVWLVLAMIIPCAGLVEAGDCSAWPCNCGESIIASITMTSDLTGCSYKGLVIGALDIILDCQGYSLVGDDSDLEGISNTNYNNITIQNCNISGFTQGIYYNGSSSGFIINNSIYTTAQWGYGIDLIGSGSNLIENNTVNTSGKYGYAVYLNSSSSSNTLNNNQINTSGLDGYGVYVWSSNSNELNDNLIVTGGNSGHGVYSRDSDRTALDNNTITTTGNTAYGVYVYDGSDSNRLTNTTIVSEGRGSYGVYIYQSESGILVENKINTSKGVGLIVEGQETDTLKANIRELNQTIGEDNLVEGLAVAYNYSLTDQVVYSNTELMETYGQVICAFCNNVTYDGVGIGSDGLSFFNSSEVKVQDSQINATKGVGIFLFGSSDSAVIVNNTINTSADYGFGVYIYSSDSANVSSNTFNTTGDYGYGIYADDSNQNVLAGNVIKTNGSYGYGIYVQFTSNQTEIKDNEIFTIGSNGYGIGLDSSDANNLSNNTLNTSGSYGYGVNVLSSDSNNLINNTVITYGATGEGILIQGTSTGNTFLNNNLTSEQSKGISDTTGSSYFNTLTYNNDYGEISWFKGDLTFNGNLSLGTNIYLANNTVAFNSSAATELNESANITIYQLFFTTITEIYRVDNYTTNATKIRESGTNCLGVNCTQISYGANQLVFNATLLSSFSANGTDISENTAPDTAVVLVNASSAYNTTTDNLLCWSRGEDGEQTTLYAYWKWFNGSEETSSGSTIIDNGTLTNIASVSSGSTLMGQNWSCSVLMGDGLVNATEWFNASIVVKSYKCGDSVTYTSNLTEDVLDCDTSNGLNIATNNVVFDCQGYMVNGSNVSGIYVTGTNVTVKNCVIDGFSYGIYSNGGDEGIILNNTIGNATVYGVYTSQTDWSELANNTIGDSATGFYVYGGNNSFENNYLANNKVGYKIDDRAEGNNFTTEQVINHSSGVLTGEMTNEGLLNSYEQIFRDMELSNNTFDVNLSGGQGKNFTFINSSINKSKLYVSGPVAYFKWYVDVNVTDSAEAALENATVKSYTSLNELEDSQLTGSNGVGRLEVTEFYRLDQTNYYITPSTIKANKGNYTYNQTTINLYNQTYGQVNLSLALISCGNTVSYDLELGNNYSCTGDGLVVGADNIIIDGKGYSLSGSGSNRGIRAEGWKRIVVKDLQISDFAEGIYLLKTNNSNFTGLTVLNNTYGVVFNNSDNNRVEDGSLEGNSAYGAIGADGAETNNSLINVTLKTENISMRGAASIFRKWYVEVNATYDSSGLPNADVYGYFNSSGELDDSATTNSQGIGRLVLAELRKNSSGTTYLTPHNITLSYALSGENITNSTEVNLSQTNNTKVNLSVELNCTSPYSNMEIESTTLFCPGTFTVQNIQIKADNLNLTCESTILQNSILDYSARGISIENKSNITIKDCEVKNHGRGVYVYESDNINISGLVSTEALGGVSCYNSKEIRLEGSTISNLGYIDVYLDNCSSSVITNNTLGGTLGISLDKSDHNTINNNTFSSLSYGIAFVTEPQAGSLIGNPSNNNSVYHNVFSSISSYNVFYFNGSSTSYVNHFNTSVGGYGQGNEWSDYCDKGTDLNSDGYADNVSSAGNDWPYSENISSKIYDETNNNGGVIDYGPKIITCPAAEVFLSPGGGVVSKAAEAGEGAEEAAEEKGAVKTKEEKEEEVYDAEETRKFLRTEAEEVGAAEKVTRIKVILENTGKKRMQLFPDLFQSIEEPFFLVDKKTLGFEGSLFWKMVGIAYSKDVISGRLLKAEILNPEQIILEPGERIEKVLEIKEGLIAPREVRIQFTTLGEVVKEEEVKMERKALTGTAVDVDQEGMKIDIYALLVPEEAAKGLEKAYEEEAKGVVGAAVWSKSEEEKEEKKEGEQYWLELSINKAGKGSSFAELYGPYKLKERQTLVFGQQLKYDPETYKGEYEVETKIYKGNEVLVKNEFGVELGAGKESLSWWWLRKTVKWSWLWGGLVLLLFGGLSGYYIHRVRRKTERGKEKIAEKERERREEKRAGGGRGKKIVLGLMKGLVLAGIGLLSWLLKEEILEWGKMIRGWGEKVFALLGMWVVSIAVFLAVAGMVGYMVMRRKR